MRILLADTIGPLDAARAEVDAYLAAQHDVNINTHALSAVEVEQLREHYRENSQVQFCNFDPAAAESLRATITEDQVGYDAIIYPANLEGFTSDVLTAAADKALKHPLRIIGCANDAISHLKPIEALASQHGVSILHTQGVHADAVAEYTLSQITFFARGLGRFYEETGIDGKWPHHLAAQNSRTLAGKTLGVIGGSGSDGTAVIALAKKMGMNVVAMSNGGSDSAEKMRSLGAQVAHSLPEMLQQADFLSVNCRNNEHTRGLIDTAAIAAMKPGMVIINPAGAEILDKQALLAEYQKPAAQRRIKTVVLDMAYGGRRDAQAFATDADNAVLKSLGVIFTPRVAGYTMETRRNATEQLARRIDHALGGQLAPALDQQQLVRDIIALTKQAGERAVAAREAGLDVAYGADNSPSTNADKMAAALIREGLQKKGYQFQFTGEEQEQAATGQGVDGYEIVIDGIDGTRNFRDGNYGWCSSVAVRHNGETIIGVVHDPKCDETFWAIKGGGAYLEDKRGVKSLKVPAELTNDFSFSIGSFFIQNSTAVKNKIKDDIKLLGGRGREWGSVALSLCAVARGGLGAFIQGNSKAHDHAAGVLIAQEAGADVALRPSTKPEYADVVAAHPQLSEQIGAIYDQRILAIPSVMRDVGGRGR